MVIIISITLDHLYEQAVANNNRATEPHYEAVQRVVRILTSKTSSLPGEYREDALKLVKGLAFISFTGQGVNKGIHIRELVEGLDLAGKERYARELIYQLREITGGQFIDQFGEDYFTLDLVHCIDYDEVLRKKASLLSREDEIKGLVLFLQKAFDLDDSKRVSDNLFYDYFYWPARNGFQQVVVAFNESRITEGAPALVINMNSSQEKSPEARKVIINLIYSQSLGSLIKELMVVLNYTESSNYPTAYLKRKKNSRVEIAAKVKLCVYSLCLLFKTKSTSGSMEKIAANATNSTPSLGIKGERAKSVAPRCPGRFIPPSTSFPWVCQAA